MRAAARSRFAPVYRSRTWRVLPASLPQQASRGRSWPDTNSGNMPSPGTAPISELMPTLSGSEIEPLYSHHRSNRSGRPRASVVQADVRGPQLRPDENRWPSTTSAANLNARRSARTSIVYGRRCGRRSSSVCAVTYRFRCNTRRSASACSQAATTAVSSGVNSWMAARHCGASAVSFRSR